MLVPIKDDNERVLHRFRFKRWLAFNDVRLYTGSQDVTWAFDDMLYEMLRERYTVTAFVIGYLDFDFEIHRAQMSDA